MDDFMNPFLDDDGDEDDLGLEILPQLGCGERAAISECLCPEGLYREAA